MPREGAGLDVECARREIAHLDPGRPELRNSCTPEADSPLRLAHPAGNLGDRGSVGYLEHRIRRVGDVGPFSVVVAEGVDLGPVRPYEVALLVGKLRHFLEPRASSGRRRELSERIRGRGLKVGVLVGRPNDGRMSRSDG